MEFPCHAVLPLFCLALIGSLNAAHALLPAEEYWRSLWPNTPMPQTLRHLAHPGVWIERNSNEDEMGKGKLKVDELLMNNGTASESSNLKKMQVPHNSTSFFFEQDLQGSMKITPLIQSRVFYAYTFQVEPDEAGTPKLLINYLCHKNSTSNEVEDTFCATSFESLISFPISKLGKNIRVLPEEVEKETLKQKQQTYKIGEGVKKVGDRVVVCHKLKYPYVVFYCHDDHATRAYKVPFVAHDGTKIMALAVCHTNTSGWSPKHLAFQELKVKPGTIPVCHFLATSTLLWYLVKP